MRKCVLAANWKMNLSSREISDYAARFLEGLRIDENSEALFFSPFPYLSMAVEKLGGEDKIGIGAQNLHWESSGAFTGEVSGEMIRDVGAGYVLVGHSERRKYFGETDETVNKKMKTALGISLRPVLCLGETWEEREAGKTEEVTTRSLLEGIRDIGEDDLGMVYVAYEPVWAIGTGVNATPEQAEEVHARLRGLIAREVGKDLADVIPILYGGSANPDNTSELMSEPDIDGLLVGGASLDPEKFRQMIDAGQEAVRG
jgi:triosephosphate isomerase